MVTHDTDDEGSAVLFQDFMKMQNYAFLLIYHSRWDKKRDSGVKHLHKSHPTLNQSC